METKNTIALVDCKEDDSAKRLHSQISQSSSDNFTHKKPKKEDSAYPDTLGELLSGIKGDFESVLSSGVSMFSSAFSFFSDGEAAVAAAEARELQDSKAKDISLKRRKADKSQTVGEALAIARQNEALKFRLPSLWTSSANVLASENIEKVPVAASNLTKGPDFHKRDSETGAVRVKEGDIVNLSILSTKTTLSSFPCADNNVLIVGNRRMIMTQGLLPDKSEVNGHQALAPDIKMAKVVWSQAFHEIASVKFQVLSDSRHEESNTLLEIELENSQKKLNMLLPSVDNCRELLAVIQKKRAAIALKPFHVEMPSIAVNPGMNTILATTAPVGVSGANSPKASLMSISSSSSSEIVVEPKLKDIVTLTPGSYCKVDICVRQLKHGVSEYGVRGKLVKDGISADRAETILAHAKRVMGGATLSLVPGGKNVKVQVMSPEVDQHSPDVGTIDVNLAARENMSLDSTKTSASMTPIKCAPSKDHGQTNAPGIDVGAAYIPSAAKVVRPPKRDNLMGGLNKDLLGKIFEAPTIPIAAISKPKLECADRLPEKLPMSKSHVSSVEVSIPVSAPAELGSIALARTGLDVEGAVTFAQHPLYSKYFKMLKVGLPVSVVKSKMTAEGLDPNLLDNDPNGVVPVAPPTSGVALSEHPIYAKYFKMLKVGLPSNAVKNKMVQEGVDPNVLDRNPLEIFSVSVAAESANLDKQLPKSAKKKQPRKKKFHWNTIETHSVSANSLWAQEDCSTVVDIDEDEFNSLFVESICSPKKTAITHQTDSNVQKEKKKTVYLVDMKRGQNAAIALARIKMTFIEVRSCLEALDDSHLTPDQLQNIVDYLPTAEEKKLLKDFRGDIELLGQAEKFMLEMLACTDAAKSLACLQFKQQFHNKCSDIASKIMLIAKACDDAKSLRLKKVLKTVLQVGNQMNGNQSNMGFTLDSLLKLSSAKAFDKTTSLLTYIIMLIHRNDQDCLKFTDDIQSAHEASRLTMHLLLSEKNELKSALQSTCENVQVLSLATSTSHPALDRFLDEAKESMNVLENQYQLTMQKYSEVLTYFGQSTSTSSEEFFGTLNKFSFEFSAAREDFLRKKQRADKMKKTASMTATKVVQKNIGTKDVSNKENKENLNDNIVE